MRLQDTVVVVTRAPRALTGWLRSEYGRVDALVNNASVAARDRLPHVDLETWRRTFDINVTGPLLGIQALVPLMPAGSSIVNICSVAAVSGHVAAGAEIVVDGGLTAHVSRKGIADAIAGARP